MVEACEFQGHAVQVVDVPRAVGHHYGVERAHRIQLFAENGAVLCRLGVVVLESLHPSPWRCGFHPLPEGRLDGSDGGQVAVGGHHVAYTAVQHVDVSVDEPGQHGVAREVQHLHVGADERLHVPVAAHANDAAIAHGHGLGPGTAGVHGNDVGVPDDRIGLGGNSRHGFTR